MSSKNLRGLNSRDTDGDASHTNDDGQPGLDPGIWTEPERTYTIYGELSAPFVTCRECGTTVCTGDIAQASHDEECPHGRESGR